MPSIKTGTFTIKQVIQLTYESPYKNRFEYRKRDKINLVRIRRIKQFNPSDLNHPTYLIEAYSQSTPNYKPYLTKYVTKAYRKGSKTYERKSQRYYKNLYNIYFRIWGSTGSINSKQWAIRLGEDKIYKKYPKKMIKSKSNPHGKFLSNGHANAVLRGINADFFFF
jgi:hypothetical protein